MRKHKLNTNGRLKGGKMLAQGNALGNGKE